MRVEGPVARVVEYEDGVDFEGFGGVGVVDCAGEGPVALHGCEIDGHAEGPDAWVGHEDVGWSYHVGESVPGE